MSVLRNQARMHAVFPAPEVLTPLPKCSLPREASVKSDRVVKVPKIVWRTWRDDSWKIECRSAHDRTLKTLPDWDHRVCTDKDCQKFVSSEFKQHPSIVKAFSLCNYGVMKADLWRYLVLYKHGGLYLDMKSTAVSPPCFASQYKVACSFPVLFTSPWNLAEKDLFHKHLFTTGELQQFWIAAEPGSPVLWEVIRQTVVNILAIDYAASLPTPRRQVPSFLLLPKTDCVKSRILSCTGPVMFSYVVGKWLDTRKCTVRAGVQLVSPDCKDSINYWPPVKSEMTSYRDDHYAKHAKPLTTPACHKETENASDAPLST